MRVLEALAVVLLLLAPVPVDTIAQTDATEADRDTPKLDRISNQTAFSSAVALSDERVAWAGPRDDTIGIYVYNLTSGQQRLVTQIADPDDEVRVDSLGFDGRWIAWADDRFGDLEVFVVDTRSGNLTRLTNDDARDRHVDLSEGRIVWARGTAIHMAAPSTGQQTVFREEAGRAPRPQIDEQTLSWIRRSGRGSTIFAEQQGIDNVANVTFVREGGIVAYHLGDGRVAWTEARLEVEGREVQQIQGYVTSTARLTITDDEHGEPALTARDRINLTGLTAAGHVVTSTDHVAWIAERPGLQGNVRAVDLATGRNWTLPGSTGGLAISDEHLVFGQPVAGSGGRSEVSLVAMAWPDPPPADGGLDARWWLVGAGAALILVGLLWDPLRRLLTSNRRKPP